jgi:hypothetical protein
MSANQATFSDSFDFNLLARGIAVTARRVRVYSGIQPTNEHAETSSADTVFATEVPQGLVSLLGKYNNDPAWEEFPAFLEQYRREIDEINRE